MGKIKKILCMLLVCTVIIAPCSLLGSVFAQTGNSVPLTVEVTTDKSSYTAYGIAEITVNVTNTSNETINNISAEAVFDELAPVGKNSETFKNVETLELGESFSFSYKATVNANKVKLNFFEKIILWFVRLFNGGYSATEHNISIEIEDITNIMFGSHNVKNKVVVGHGKVSYFSDEDVENRQKVLTSLSDLMSSEEYQSKEDIEKVDLVENLLSQLEKDGLINNVSYNSDTKYFHYNFTCGGKGSVSIKSEKKYSDPSLNPVGLTNNNSTTLIRQNETNIITNSNSNTSTSAILMYGFDKPYDENRQFEYWYNSCKSKSNMQTAVLDCPTVYEFKTELLNKDFICIFEHGNYGGIVDNTYVFKVQNEEITEKTDFAYDTDLYFERIVTHTDDNGERFYCITPKFFELYYKNKLNNAIVYLDSCQGFGKGTIFDYGIAETLIEQCGAKTVIGFHNTVAQNYTYRIYNEITDLLLKGFTIGEAYNYTVDKLGATDYTFLKEHLFEVEDMSTRRNWLEVANEKQETGNVATFLLHGDESAILITPPNLTGTVKDETTGNAISGVSVEVIDNSSDSLDPVITTTTDENGQFTINLPYGDYSISFNHEDYEHHGIMLSVDSDNVVLLDDILLTPKDSSGDDDEENGDSENNNDNVNGDISHGTEMASGTCGVEGDNVTWTLYDDGKIVISGNGEMLNYSHYIYAPWYSANESILEIVIESGITNIGNCAFSHCYNLKNITIPNSIISIGDSAFFTCDSLINITIPDSVITIGNSAFYSCDKLMSVTMSNNIISIGSNSFGYCTNLTNVTLPNSVRKIGSEAFANCNNFTNVMIPNSVTTIGNRAFSSCINLTHISVDANNQYYSSDEHGVLFDKGKKVLIQYPAGNSRASFTIPNGVITIGCFAFENSDKLTNITIPNSVETISNYAFEECDGFTNVTIPNSVTKIGNYAFFKCYNLKSITISNGVIIIGENAFKFCENLINVTIPESVQIIENGAFFGCTRLGRITILNPNCEIYDSPDTFTSAGGVWIIGYAGSTAETYAESNNKRFVLLD